MSEWMNAAACRDEDPARMMPAEATPDELEDTMRLCRGCPVRLECDELRARQEFPHGVWAGRWWGDPPADPTVSGCQWCQEPAASPQATYCGPRCRKAASRARALVSA